MHSHYTLSHTTLSPPPQVSKMYGALNIDFNNGSHQELDITSTMLRPQMLFKPTFFDFKKVCGVQCNGV
jgi:hypothetical protein